MSQAESWTVLRLLTWTTDFLKSHGAETPRLDAEVLLAHARGCERIMLYAAFDEIVSDEVRGKFRESVKLRAAGTPVAYLVGQREVYSLPLRVTPEVLIPRPETEFVVVAALDALKSHKLHGPESHSSGSPSPQPPTPSPLVCDVGTGSGAIAIAIARHAADCRLTAIDSSPEALEVARENAANLGVADRIDFLEGDLLAPLRAAPQFTAIVSKQPYTTAIQSAAPPALVLYY
jgi:release factor glutamine methyltransferase